MLAAVIVLAAIIFPVIEPGGIDTLFIDCQFNNTGSAVPLGFQK